MTDARDKAEGPPPDDQAGRAWRRPRRDAPRDAGEAGRPAPPPDAAAPPDESPPTAGYRMQLGEAAAEEARRHQLGEARRRLDKARPWLSMLLMLGLFGLALDAVAFVFALVGTADFLVVVLIVAFLPPALAAWVLSLYCTVKLRDWGWAVVLGLTPLVIPIIGVFVLLPSTLVFAFPLPILIGAVVYPWRLRHQLFDEAD